MTPRLLVCALAASSLVAAQTAALADPHAEGLAAGRAAIPAARAGITAPSAAEVVPGYTTAPAEATYYRQPDLAAQARAHLAQCTARPDDPACQAQRGALESARTPRPEVGPGDPAVAAARDITRSPSALLDDLVAWHVGCIGAPAGAAGCAGTTFCVQGRCFDTGRPDDPDFARSTTFMEAAREAGVYLDTERLQVFAGEDSRCRDRLLGNCCQADTRGAAMTNGSLFGVGSRLVYDVLMNAGNRRFVTQGLQALLTGGGFGGSFTTYGVTVAVNGTALPAGSVLLHAGDGLAVAFDPWTLAIAVVLHVVMSMMSCSADEGRLAMQEGARLCRTVGTYCSSCIRVLGRCVSCIEHTTSKCCFNSVLARIVNEQGRVQVGKGWGSAKAPDCSGFTVAQLQALDFAAMDLSEFYASLVPVLPDEAALRAQAGGRVPACYHGQGRCQ
ncbi:conjugal transfer protein TraN [Azohydromonas aeria]|uniref:conjugal transfer protein TraN n=1 Tax=Azohydromonas aeria TaxID=2590212 RepID=UPI0012F8B98B|nr:conjugal transfer protein TraN [Azohydromonas aeria]